MEGKFFFFPPKGESKTEQKYFVFQYSLFFWSKEFSCLVFLEGSYLH